MKEMKESLLIIKTTEWQMDVKQFKSFRLTRAKGRLYKSGNFTRVKTKSSLGLNFW